MQVKFFKSCHSRVVTRWGDGLTRKSKLPMLSASKAARCEGGLLGGSCYLQCKLLSDKPVENIDLPTGYHPDNVTAGEQSVYLLSTRYQRFARKIRLPKAPTLNCVPCMCSSSRMPETYALLTLERSRSTRTLTQPKHESQEKWPTVREILFEA